MAIATGGKKAVHRAVCRTQRGSQLAEFAPALIVLIAFVVIPMLDLVIVPIRWMLAQDIVNGYARRLALCETFSQAFQVMESDPSLATRLKQLGGVGIDNINLRMRITRDLPKGQQDDPLVVDGPRQIPDAWLPDGPKAPCRYSLELDVNSEMSPAILLPTSANKIPGLNAPLRLLISSSHEWANLGRNPINKQFFLNE